MEASFVDEEFIISTVSELVHQLFTDQGFSLEYPFPRLTYEEADNLYGTDKPDLRFGMAFFDATELFTQTRYGIFKNVLEKGGTIKGICVPEAANRLSKNTLQQEYCQELVPSFGGKGMTWAKVEAGQLQSNIVQFFSLSEQKALVEVAKAKDGDVLLLIADIQKKTVNHVLGKLRLHVAAELSLAKTDCIKPLWVTEFPLFEMKDKRRQSVHHPFTAPLKEITASDSKHLLSLKSRSYDLVVSGEELGGGSMRIHDFRVQEKIFSLLGMGQSEIEEKFGFFLRAFQYGLPPHGGIALGLDRLVSMLAGVSSIREVIAFPKNRRAICPLTKAPGPVDLTQLKELGIDRLEKWMEANDQVPEKKEEDPLGKERIHLTSDDIGEVAALAMIDLTEYEKTEFQKDLEVILKHADQLLSVDTKKVDPLFRFPYQQGTMRPDRGEPSLDAVKILAEAPELEGAYFKVPRVLNK
jgi:aspartyl-tRNA synthetase